MFYVYYISIYIFIILLPIFATSIVSSHVWTKIMSPMDHGFPCCRWLPQAIVTPCACMLRFFRGVNLDNIGGRSQHSCHCIIPAPKLRIRNLINTVTSRGHFNTGSLTLFAWHQTILKVTQFLVDILGCSQTSTLITDVSVYSG